MRKLKRTADWLISRLKAEGIVVQRYDSYSSHSIYLKLDYGVCHTIRISDHKGKKHLAYRYNILTCCPDLIATKDSVGRIKYYFPIGKKQVLLNKILFDRYQIYKKYGEYQYKGFMERNLQNSHLKKGFWKSARLV